MNSLPPLFLAQCKFFLVYMVNWWERIAKQIFSRNVIFIFLVNKNVNGCENVNFIVALFMDGFDKLKSFKCFKLPFNSIRRAEYGEKTVQKLNLRIDSIINELVAERCKTQNVNDQLDETFELFVNQWNKCHISGSGQKIFIFLF